MTIYRSCSFDSLAARVSMQRQQNLAERANAILTSVSGVPADPVAPTGPGIAPPPEAVISSASWVVTNPTTGLLPAGTYTYALIPVDTLTGKTGTPIALPSLTIATLGEIGTLSITFTSISENLSVYIQRNGTMVGNPLPVVLLQNYPLTSDLATAGTYNTVTDNGFTRTGGATLQVNDTVDVAGFSFPVMVASVVGNVVTVSPPFVPNGTPSPPFVLPPSSGTFTRLSRTMQTTIVNNFWQYIETGTHQTRTGTQPSAATTGVALLNQIITQSGYEGGLTGLNATILGATTSTASRVFVETNGQMTQIGNRLVAVNQTALDTTTTTINMANIRTLQADICPTDSTVTSTVVTEAALNGYSVVRYREVTTVSPGAACPPGAPTSSSQYVCDGIVTTTNRARPTDRLKVFFSPGANLRTGMRNNLMKLGLTKDASQNAINLVAEGAVVDVVEFTQAQVSDSVTLSTIEGNADAAIADTRIQTVSADHLNNNTVQAILQLRGIAGIVKRAANTSPTEPKVLEDLALSATKFLSQTFTFQESFDLCGFDEALNSIADPIERALFAAAFAVIEFTFTQARSVGISITAVLQAAVDSLNFVNGIGGILINNPFTQCLLGPINQMAVTIPSLGIPSLPLLTPFLLEVSTSLRLRFDTVALALQIQRTALCQLQGVIQKYTGVGADVEFSDITGAALKCIPLLNISPSLEVGLTFTCASERLNMWLELLDGAIAEINEFIAWLNTLTARVSVTNQQNNACAGDQGMFEVFSAINQTLFSALP
jgi:hypothetical protein